MHTVQGKVYTGPDFLCRYMLLRTECPTQHSAQSKGQAMMNMTPVSGCMSKLRYKAAQLDQGRSTHKRTCFLAQLYQTSMGHKKLPGGRAGDVRSRRRLCHPLTARDRRCGHRLRPPRTLAVRRARSVLNVCCPWDAAQLVLKLVLHHCDELLRRCSVRVV